MSRRRWQEWRSRGDPAITFRLLPPTPDKPGRLVIEEGALSTIVTLSWEPPLIAVHLAGRAHAAAPSWWCAVSPTAGCGCAPSGWKTR